MSLTVTAICMAVVLPPCVAVLVYFDSAEPRAAADGGAATTTHDRITDLVREELESDWSAMWEDSVLSHLLKVPETLLALGLTLRVGVHIAAYLIANPTGSPTLGRHLSLDPIAARRPAWNEWTSRIACAAFGSWLFTLPVPVAADAHPALVALLAANVGVLVADPVFGGIEFVTNLNSERIQGSNHA